MELELQKGTLMHHWSSEAYEFMLIHVSVHPSVRALQHLENRTSDFDDFLTFRTKLHLDEV